jgi:hypothetical protein
MKKIYLPLALMAMFFGACSKDNNKTANPVVIEAPKDSIVTYTDVYFSTGGGGKTYGRAFSSLTGKIYLDDAIPDTMGKHIDVIFGCYGTGVMFFSSPDNTVRQPNPVLIIPGATTTVISNYHAENNMSQATFDTLTHASALKALEVIGDSDSFSYHMFPYAVYFQNAVGKKGVIMLKALGNNNDYVIGDVKVEY